MKRRVMTAVTNTRWLAAAVLALGAAATAQAADSEARSAALTKELSALMAERQMDAIGAHDPQAPGRFVAAMFFPGV